MAAPGEEAASFTGELDSTFLISMNASANLAELLKISAETKGYLFCHECELIFSNINVR